MRDITTSEEVPIKREISESMWERERGGDQRWERGRVGERTGRGMEEDCPCNTHTVLGSNGGDKMYRCVGSGRCGSSLLLLLCSF